MNDDFEPIFEDDEEYNEQGSKPIFDAETGEYIDPETGEVLEDYFEESEERDFYNTEDFTPVFDDDNFQEDMEASAAERENSGDIVENYDDEFIINLDDPDNVEEVLYSVS